MSQFYPTPKFAPTDTVIYYTYYDSTKHIPIIASISCARWDENHENWRYDLAGVNMAILEPELTAYSKGSAVSKRITEE